ncbi:MAG: sugar ABC transporter permease [Chloroflexi bacterium HGW-Chloroflexi-10]|nr:MAG: sugar ABC transporter permease [Chloroflexi bacterium HGW-Chloroflexi-10]
MRKVKKVETRNRSIPRWKLSRYVWIYTFLLPVCTSLVLFRLYPLARTIWLAFFRWDIHEQGWVGLQNFFTLFQSTLFQKTILHTFQYTILVVIAWLFSSLWVAVGIHHWRKSAKAIIRSAFYLPHLVGVVVLTLVWAWVFEPQIGLANQLLNIINIGPVLWLQKPQIALWSVILSSVLVVPGSGVVIYSAALAGIPKVYAEVADVEGASAWQRFLYVTLPLLKPASLYLLVIYTIAGFQVFERVYLLTGGGPVNATTTIVQTIYKTAFRDANYGLASAQSVVLLVLIGLVTWAYFRWLGQDVHFD